MCACDTTVGPLAHDICFVVRGFLLTPFIRHLLTVKVNQSRYRPEVPRGFQEVKVTRLRDKVVSFRHRPLLPPRNTLGTHFC